MNPKKEKKKKKKNSIVQEGNRGEKKNLLIAEGNKTKTPRTPSLIIPHHSSIPVNQKDKHMRAILQMVIFELLSCN